MVVTSLLFRVELRHIATQHHTRGHNYTHANIHIHTHIYNIHIPITKQNKHKCMGILYIPTHINISRTKMLFN